MAYARDNYVGDGSTTNFGLTFPYLSQDHVKVSVDGVDTAFTWLTSSVVVVSPAPAVAAVVSVYRVTPITVPVNDFANGSILNEEQLDVSFLQALYVTQEAYDATESAIVLTIDDYYDAQNKQIKNVATPTASGDAVNKGYADTILDTTTAARDAALAAQAAAEAAQAAAETARVGAETAETNAAASETAAAASEAACAASEAVLTDRDLSVTHNMTSDADYTLSAGEVTYGRIVITDTSVLLTTARNIIVPVTVRGYYFENQTAQILTFKTAAGSGVIVAPSDATFLFCDGTNVVDPLTGVSGGATGGGADDIFYENSQTVNTDYTITSGKNAMSAGPITIAGGVTVTVPAGSEWTVV